MHTLYYAVAFAGLYAILGLILALFWQGTTRLPLQKKSKSVLFTIAILIALSIISNLVKPIWLNMFVLLEIAHGDLNDIKIISDNAADTISFSIGADLSRSLTACYIFVAAYLAHTLLGYFIWNGLLLDPESGEPYVPAFLQNIVGGLFFAIALLASVALYYPNLFSGTLATLGASGAIGAFVAADPIKKAITAISLNVNKPIKQGEFLRIGDVEGTVDSIGWRAIRLITVDNSLLTIPTANFLSANYINYSRPQEGAYVSIDVTMRTAVVSPERLRALLKRCAEDSPLSVGEATVFLVKMDAVFSEYLVTVRAAQYNMNQVKNDLLSSIWYMSRREGFLPYPKDYALPEDNKVHAVKLLNNVSSLSTLNDEEDLIVAEKAVFKWYGYPERIVIQNEVENSVYVIAQGSVDIVVQQADGSQIKVSSLTKNNIFGEIGLLTGAARTATIRATNDVLICKISKEALQPLIANNPSIIEQLGEVLAERETTNSKAFKQYSEEQKAREKQGAKEKLVSLMSDFFKQTDDDDDDAPTKTS